MAEMTYTTVTGRIEPFFAKIQHVSVPTKADQKWLKQIGFVGSNDSTLLRVAKFLGFIDQADEPTDRWKEYRDKGNARRVMAQALRESYVQLFQTYSDAHACSDDDLKNFFTFSTDKSAETVSAIVTTFKNLCALADFENSGATSQTVAIAHEAQAESNVNPVESPQSFPVSHIVRGLGSDLTINLNIQLTVPETTNKNVYDDFFAALKKHLLT